MDSILNFPFYAINFLSDHLFKQKLLIITYSTYLNHIRRNLIQIEKSTFPIFLSLSIPFKPERNPEASSNLLRPIFPRVTKWTVTCFILAHWLIKGVVKSRRGRGRARSVTAATSFTLGRGVISRWIYIWGPWHQQGCVALIFSQLVSARTVCWVATTERRFWSGEGRWVFPRFIIGALRNAVPPFLLLRSLSRVYNATR